MYTSLLKRLFPRILDDFPDGILAFDMKTMNILDANNTVLDMLGYKKDELSGSQIFTIHPVEQKQWIESIIKNLSVSRMQYICEISFVRKNGETFSADIASRIVKQNGYQIAVGFIRDRTRLNNEATAWKTIYNHLSEMIDYGVCLTTACRIVYANQSLIEIFGATSLQQVIGRNLTDFIPENQWEEHKRNYESVISGVRPMLISNRQFKRLNGGNFRACCKMSRIQVHGKWMLQAILFVPGMNFRDVTVFGEHDFTGGEKSISLLTVRETEILRFIASGCTVKEVAGKLCISRRTVSTHKLNIMIKLNIHSTANLVKFAIKNQVIAV